jgi:shikimate kinase
MGQSPSENAANMRSIPVRPRAAGPSASATGAQVVFLVGFMGAGKSSVGQALARRLSWSFEDLDRRIEAREGRTIEQIFRQTGEAGFRETEHAALKELLAEPRTISRVVALGGGAFAEARNAGLVKEAGAEIVFLDAPVEELFRRCRQENAERPLLRDLDNFRKLYESRRPSYVQAGYHIETGGKSVDTIAAEVACSIGLLTGEAQ